MASRSSTSSSSSSAVLSERTTYVDKTAFTIDSKYNDLKVIGKGSYGVVCSAIDTSNSTTVAIKKITPISKHSIDAKHVLREIRLMRHMGKHENIISLRDLHVRDTADELYIVMELMDSDLHRVLQSTQVLSEAHLKYFLAQLICGTRYLHANRIIHRDLKPGNLLVSRDCKLRITDFGLARERPIGKGSNPDDLIDEPMTEHVVTRWYRPPELMLCPDGLYTYAVDMWSIGTIFAEMILRKPIFPGKNFVHQLTLIFDVIGSPLPQEVSHIKNVQAKKFLESQVGKQKVPFAKIFSQASADTLNLIENLLIFDPKLRMDAETAMKLPYLRSSTSSASLNFPTVPDDFDFSFEKMTSKGALKQLIFSEALSLKTEIKAKNKASSPPSELLRGTSDVKDQQRVQSASSTSTGRMLPSSSSSSAVNDNVNNGNTKGTKKTNTIDHQDQKRQYYPQQQPQPPAPRSPVRLLSPKKEQKSLSSMLDDCKISEDRELSEEVTSPFRFARANSNNITNEAALFIKKSSANSNVSAARTLSAKRTNEKQLQQQPSTQQLLNQRREVYTSTTTANRSIGGAYGGSKLIEKKKKLTIPQSPKFSTLSSHRNMAKIPRISNGVIPQSLKEARSLSAGVSRVPNSSRMMQRQIIAGNSNNAIVDRSGRPVVRPKSGPSGR